MPDLHPLLVHFPVALLTFSVAVDLAGHVLRKELATVVGWWAQLAGTAGILLSVGSGLLAKGRLTDPAHLEHLATHEQGALLGAGIFLVLSLWRVGARGRIPSRVYILALVVGIVLVWGTAWYGGELVYRYGVGVAP